MKARIILALAVLVGLVLVSGCKMWVIEGNPGVVKNDVLSSVDGVTWVQETAAAAFPVRGLHTSVVFNSKMWVIGGLDEKAFMDLVSKDDVWSSLDGATWVQEAAAAAFPARAGHTSVVFNSKMWVIGGLDGAFMDLVSKNDVLSSVDGVTWVQETAAAAFPARAGHTSVVFNPSTGSGQDGKMWVIGGLDFQ